MKMKNIIYTLMILGLSLKSAAAHEEIQKYEDCLNEMKTLSGEFTQINSKGHTSTGTIQISRPGRLCLTYNPPSSLLIMADGKWLITRDRAADEVNYSSLEKTPAGFILQPHVRFDGDVAVTKVARVGDMTEISLIRKEEPDAGAIILVFKDNPTALHEWRVIDPQGIETQVILSNIQTNVDLPNEIFAIESPSLLQQIF